MYINVIWLVLLGLVVRTVKSCCPSLGRGSERYTSLLNNNFSQKNRLFTYVQLQDGRLAKKTSINMNCIY